MSNVIQFPEVVNRNHCTQRVEGSVADALTAFGDSVGGLVTALRSGEAVFEVAELDLIAAIQVLASSCVRALAEAVVPDCEVLEVEGVRYGRLNVATMGHYRGLYGGFSLNRRLFRMLGKHNGPTHDRNHQRLSDSTRPPPEASIQRRLPPQQLVTPTRSTFLHRQRHQISPCGSSWTEPALPVALLASGVLPRVHRYGGPLPERASDASTRSVAGGITTVRSCIACPHFGHPKPTTPKTRQSRELHARQRDLPCGRFERRFPTVAGLFFAFGGVGRTRARSRERDARTP